MSLNPIKLIKRLYIKSFLKNTSIHKIDALTGRQFEDVCKLFFEYAKYLVNTTPASNDFGADLILTKRLKFVVQCKLYYNHGVGTKSVQEVSSAQRFYDADVGVVISNWHFTSQAKQIAQKQSVILIDRNQIVTFLLDVKNKTKNSIIFNLIKHYKSNLKTKI